MPELVRERNTEWPAIHAAGDPSGSSGDSRPAAGVFSADGQALARPLSGGRASDAQALASLLSAAAR